jgi:WD40 repeat protein
MARSALVIGIARYSSNFRNLEKAISDAGAIAEILEQHGFYSIEPLPRKLTTGNENRYELDRDPKKEVKYSDLIAKIKIFLEQANGKDALIYFAGHGFVVADAAEDEIGYLAASDAGKDGQNALSFDIFTKLIAKSELKTLVVMLDCCHAGNLLARQYQAMQKVFIEKNYYLIAACRGSERSREGEEHGIFTAAVLKVLRRRVDLGEDVDMDRLFSEVSEQLKQSGQEVIRTAMGGSISLIHRSIASVTPIVEETCPYVGLEAFDEKTAKWFFGRDKFFSLLLQKINDSPFVFVVGVSGSGKSSLVKAKLIPEMKLRGYRVVIMKPWTYPTQHLKDALTSDLDGTGTNISEIEERIDQEGLIATISNFSSQKILLVIDQFEEVFTVCPNEDERRKFIQLLVDVAQQPNSALMIVATMRVDFLAECTYANLGDIINKQMVCISEMNNDGLKEAIERPAKIQGYKLSEGLLDAILQDIHEERNCLPLLEFALQELWGKRDCQRHLLTLEKYNEMGRLKGALNLHADKLYDLQKEAGQQWMQRIMLKLLRTGKDAKDTRQRAQRETILDLAGDDENARKLIDGVLKSLEGKSGRLLVAGEENGIAMVDLAHEALMDGWERFAEWRLENRDLRRLADRVEDCYQEWENKNKGDNYLLPNGLTMEAIEKWENIKPLISESARNYYNLSKNRDTKDKQKKVETTLREQAMKVMKDLTFYQQNAKIQAIMAEEESQENLHSEIKINAQLTAIQLVSESQEELDKVLVPLQENLQCAMKVPLRNIFQGHKGNISSVAFSSDGKTIVSGSSDWTLRLWDLQGNQINEFKHGDNVKVWSVAFSPDDKTIVSGSSDKTIRLWDVASGEQLHVFHHNDQVWSVAFSPDGKTIVSGSSDKTIRLWDIADGEQLHVFHHDDKIWSIAFSPDGKTIVSGSSDKTIRLWDVADDNQIMKFLHDDTIWSVAFSPDGKTIVSGSSDKTIRLWDVANGNQIMKFQHDDTVLSVAFSPDGKTIVSGSSDQTVRLWNLQGEQIGLPFRGHTSLVRSVAFSPDGRVFISGSDDKTLRLRDIVGDQIGQPFREHEFSVHSVAFSPDGNTIVSGSDDKTVRLWDLQGRQIMALKHEDRVSSVAFSPDGNTIVCGSFDSTLRLWDLQGNQIGQIFQGHGDRVWSVAFSPDGNTIISGSYDRTLRLWDLQGNQIGDSFHGHEDRVWSVAFSPDGNTIVSGSSDQTLRLWDLQGNQIGDSFHGHEDRVWSVAFSPDGSTIVSGSSDRTLRLWDLQGNQIGDSFHGHKSSVQSVAFSPDGNTVVSGSSDRTLRLWDLQGNQIGGPFHGHEFSVCSVAFSSDQKTIVSGSDDTTLRLWHGGWQAWLEVCRNRLQYIP